MASSVQCYRTCQETCETKCHENSSFGHKVADMATNLFKGHPHQSSTQAQCYGQTNGYHQGDHSSTQAQCYGGHGQTHQAHGYGHGQTHQAHGYGYGQTHHSNCSSGHGQVGHKCSTSSSSCHDQKKMMQMKNKCGGEYKKKDNTRCRNKKRDGNRSCSDSSSDSDSD